MRADRCTGVGRGREEGRIVVKRLAVHGQEGGSCWICAMHDRHDTCDGTAGARRHVKTGQVEPQGCLREMSKEMNGSLQARDEFAGILGGS